MFSSFFLLFWKFSCKLSFSSTFTLFTQLSYPCFNHWVNRDIQRVLREDKERLRQMQKSQPHFTSDQRRELVEEHPWMRRGGLPAAINVKVRSTHSISQKKERTIKLQYLDLLTKLAFVFVQECVYCEDTTAAPIEEDLPDMDMGDLGEDVAREGQSQSEEPRPQPDSGSWVYTQPVGGQSSRTWALMMHTCTHIYRCDGCVAGHLDKHTHAHNKQGSMLPMWWLWGYVLLVC